MTSRIAVVLACCTLGVMCASVARADQPPPLHAGEWELTVKVQGAANVPPTVRKICRKADATVDDFVRSASTQRAQGTCTISDVVTSSSGMTYMQVCTSNQMRIVMRGTVTSAGSDAFSNTVRTHIDMGGGNARDTVTLITSRRTGPCQPGDAQEN